MIIMVDRGMNSVPDLGVRKPYRWKSAVSCGHRFIRIYFYNLYTNAHVFLGTAVVGIRTAIQEVMATGLMVVVVVIMEAIECQALELV